MTQPQPLLDNYVVFTEGVPKRLHFNGYAVADRPITDPLTGLDKVLSVLQFSVDDEDGRTVSKTLSVTSDGLASQLRAYLPGQAYRGYWFTITKRGTGFSSRYAVEALPRL